MRANRAFGCLRQIAISSSKMDDPIGNDFALVTINKIDRTLVSDSRLKQREGSQIFRDPLRRGAAMFHFDNRVIAAHVSGPMYEKVRLRISGSQPFKYRRAALSISPFK